MLRTLMTGLLILCLTNVGFAQGPRASVVIGADDVGEGNSPPGRLNWPFGVGFDRAGTMFIVELEGGRVHRFDADRQLTTIAGDGSKGYAGDGGPAKSATFNGMHNIAVMPTGDLYIADSWNHCIRKIDAETQEITTMAGTGRPGFGGDGGPASQAQFDFLMCITLNRTNDRIYCADLKNRRIRVVDLKSGLVHTAAGNGEQGVPQDGAVAVQSPLVDPRAVAVDSHENIYILERSGHALRVVRPDGTIHTVAGTGNKGDAVGPALASQLGSPKHLAVDHDDNVYIADDENARIVKYDAQAGTITPVLGRGVENPQVTLSHPHGVCVHADGSLYVVDTGHHRIIHLQDGR